MHDFGKLQFVNKYRLTLKSLDFDIDEKYKKIFYSK